MPVNIKSQALKQRQKRACIYFLLGLHLTLQTRNRKNNERSNKEKNSTLKYGFA